jgi:hypothetical protein
MLTFTCTDISDNMLRWERAVQDDEDALTSARKAESQQLSEIDKDMKELERSKTQRLTKKVEADKLEEDIGKVDFT